MFGCCFSCRQSKILDLVDIDGLLEDTNAYYTMWKRHYIYIT